MRSQILKITVFVFFISMMFAGGSNVIAGREDIARECVYFEANVPGHDHTGMKHAPIWIEL